MNVEITGIVALALVWSFTTYCLMMALRTAGLRNRDLVEQIRHLTSQAFAFKTHGAAEPVANLFDHGDGNATADHDQGEDEHLA